MEWQLSTHAPYNASEIKNNLNVRLMEWRTVSRIVKWSIYLVTNTVMRNQIQQIIACKSNLASITLILRTPCKSITDSVPTDDTPERYVAYTWSMFDKYIFTWPVIAKMTECYLGNRVLARFPLSDKVVLIKN